MTIRVLYMLQEVLVQRFFFCFVLFLNTQDAEVGQPCTTFMHHGSPLLYSLIHLCQK